MYVHMCAYSRLTTIGGRTETCGRGGTNRFTLETTGIPVYCTVYTEAKAKQKLEFCLP